MSRIFPGHKNKTFMTTHKNVLACLELEKTSVGIGQPITGHYQAGSDEGEDDDDDDDDDVWISDYRVCTETAKGEERIWKQKSALKKFLMMMMIIIIIIIISSSSSSSSTCHHL
jgi:hypothetical protein